MSAAMLSTDEARELILAAARPLTETETLAADTSLGRVLAQAIVADHAVPPLDNSAMDGYALRVADCSESRWLDVAQRIPAGHLGTDLAPGQAARIFTGAPIPPGADAVAMQEDCETRDHQVRVFRQPRPGANIRRRGEDIAAGQTVLAAGDRLTPARLGVVASVGCTGLTVIRRLRVAVFFTGDELVMPGQRLPPGRIYNSNRATLLALLAELGCEVIDLGQVADNLDATVEILAEASRRADVVVTSGGVSVGEEDHVRSAVARLGRIEMWKVAMKPGKPLAFGRIDACDFLGLPGNPVSAFVVYCLFVRPFLLRRMGTQPQPLQRFTVAADFDWLRPGNRREFLRVRLDQGRATLHPNQGSGVLTAVAWADGLADIAAGTTVKRGDGIPYLPFSELLR